MPREHSFSFLLFVDHVKPTIYPAPISRFIESCDVDESGIVLSDRGLFRVPSTATAEDNYDGPVTDLLRVSVLGDDGSIEHGESPQGPSVVLH